ncbi:MAG: HEAT repeat domain-containing protein [Clostridiaceae bacterium]|nr:HEAT repeat domain-containing protein [Clostridiaceae bacterium]
MGISLKKIEKWERKKKSKKLLSVLNNDNHEIRIHAIRALSGFDTLDVINALANLLRDPNSEIRLAAVETLGKIGSGKSTEFIRFMLEKESNENVKEAAKNALAIIKEKVKQEESA